MIFFAEFPRTFCRASSTFQSILSFLMSLFDGVRLQFVLLGGFFDLLIGHFPYFLFLLLLNLVFL